MKNYRTVNPALFTSAALAVLVNGLAMGPVVAQTATTEVEQVTVTAEKREENLQSVPIADTAITAADLADKNIVDLDDLRFYVPGLETYDAGPGRVNYSIRGVGSENNFSATADGGVGIFQDEVYIGRPYLANTDFLDVSQVEVLRGPQGTLFGRNTIGGAISFNSAAPDEDHRAAANLTAGNYDAVSGGGYDSGMIGDNLYAKVAVNFRTHDGYDTNLTTGARLDDESYYGLSGALRWKPTTGLDVTLNVDTSHRRGNGGWWILTSQKACPDPQTLYVAFSSPCSYSGQTQPGQINPNPRQGQQGSDNGQGDIDNTGTSLNIKWLNPIGLLTSISSYRRGDLKSRTPETGNEPEPYTYCNQALPAGETCPSTNVYGYNTTLGTWPLSDMQYTLFEYDHTEQYSEELRLSSDADSPISWIAGAFFYHEATDQTNGYNFQFNFPAYKYYYESGTGYTAGQGLTSSVALFANAAYNITDALKIQGGVRWTQDYKGTSESPYGLSANANYTLNGGATATQCSTCGPYWYVKANKTFDQATPTATVSYQVTSDLYTYATYSQGFKSGGFNDEATDNIAAATPFKSEKVVNYEFGAKTEWWDHRILFNASLFHLEYTNFQVTQQVPCTTCSKGYLFVTGNAGKAHNEGIETEFEFHPIEGLDLYGNYSYQQGQIDQGVVAGVDETGYQFQFAPSNKFSVGAAYTYGLYNFDITPRVQYSYTAHYWSQITNIPAFINPHQSSLDASLAVSPQGLNWTFEIWGKNLQNKLNTDDAFTLFNAQFERVGVPETFGATIRWHL